jgi:hypothetical protein
MSSKINILFIVRKHFGIAFRNSDTGKLSIPDILVFIGLPIAIAILVSYSKIADKSGAISLLTSVCAIFAGLLLNLLVLVYDQNKRVIERLERLKERNAGKIRPAKNLAELKEQTLSVDPLVVRYDTHKSVLGEVTVNISFSIVMSVVAAVVCIIASLLPSQVVAPPQEEILTLKTIIESINYQNLLFAVAVFFTSNLVLTLLMIVKRVIKLMEDDQ